MSRWVGIDLGTTHSLVAIAEGGSPHVLADEDGETLLPSVLAWHGGRALTGRAAIATGVSHPGSALHSVKRLMGRGLEDLGLTPSQLGVDLSGSTDAALRLNLGGRRFTPVEVSSLLLKRLKAIAEAQLGEPVERAVITVPAYFDDAQRQATLLAGKLAGLEVERLLNEPTAACLAYGLAERDAGTIAVYDLGGGTFDCSILQIRDGVFEVLATCGDTQLGGDDLDLAIADRLGASDPLEIRAARHALTEQESVVLGSTSLTREEFEALALPYIRRTLAVCDQALRDAGLTPGALDEVVLVGGATRTPLVKRLVAEHFGRAPHDGLDPDRVVAMGAALQAQVLAGERDDVLLLDVNPLSLGLETLGGGVSPLIPRNQPLPTSAFEVYTTHVDDQSAIVVHVVQGEREVASACRSLAHFTFPIDRAPAGTARLEVKFAVDSSGMLKVTARDLLTHRVQTVEVAPSHGLTDEEIAELLDASGRHAQEDKTAAHRIEQALEADNLLRAAQRGLAEAASSLAPEERDRIERATATLAALRADPASPDLEAALEELDRATRRLAELIMTRALDSAI